ncbi:Kae1-like domain-containing protein [Helicobacter sp. T3_23-1056]
MLKIHCKGITQGVGFRPFVCNLANDLGLGGAVVNVGGDGIIYLDIDYVWGDFLSGEILANPKKRNHILNHIAHKKFMRFYALHLGGLWKKDLIFCNAQKSAKSAKNGVNPTKISIKNGAKITKNDFLAFFSAFFAKLPPNAKIHSIHISHICNATYHNIIKSKTHQNQTHNAGFFILDSSPAFLSLDSHIPQDLATCEHCLSDIFSPKSRHFFYHLISCTNCGGRYSLIKSMPYDRANTAMSAYQMCGKCAKDYADTKSRFYHAQPISCNECAVPLKLYKGKKVLAKNEAAIKKVAKYLESGKIICIKGLGGFALICDSTNPLAIKNLRERKNRPYKPFAIMAQDIATAGQIAILNSAESSALISQSAPIILARQRKKNALNLALEQIAPNLSSIGILLANTALHHILFRFFAKPIIYTSANLKGEPIITNIGQAQESLEFVADYFLDFERGIYNGVDDSILRFIAGEMRPIRLARGKTPHNFELPNILPNSLDLKSQNLSKSTQKSTQKNTQKNTQKPQKILAFGAQDKTTLCYASSDISSHNAKFMLSPYIGDLASIATQEKYLSVMDFFSRIYDFVPSVLVSDFHPRYESVRYAKQMQENLAQKSETKHLQIYHHHAHLCAILGEVASSADEEILGIIWDGSGLGENGDIWGGEFLFGGFREARRVGHLQEFSLYGGEVAIKEIWRVGYALSKLCGNEKMQAKYETYFQNNEFLKIALQKGINSHKTTSVGRLFDGVASLMGILQETSYEGQSGALIEELYYQSFDLGDFGLEHLAGQDMDFRESYLVDSSLQNSSLGDFGGDFSLGYFSGDFARYPFEIQDGVVKLESFINGICEDIFLGVDLRVVARKFIRTLSAIALDFALDFLHGQNLKSSATKSNPQKSSVQKSITQKSSTLKSSEDFSKNADFSAKSSIDFSAKNDTKSSADFGAQIKVCFSGGVFQNKALCEEIHAAFLRENIPHFFHTIVPTNDSGISFGQALFGIYGKH